MESLYVDVNFYKETFKGKSIPEDVLERRLKEASHDIDSLTYNRIRKKGFDNLTKFQKEIIQESVCLHADFNYEFGEFLEMPISGYSAGTTSVSMNVSNVSNQNGVTTSNKVFSMLEQTGLTVRLFI